MESEHCVHCCFGFTCQGFGGRGLLTAPVRREQGLDQLHVQQSHFKPTPEWTFHARAEPLFRLCTLQDVQDLMES